MKYIFLKLKSLFLLLSMLSLANLLFAQQADEELAAQFLNNKEFVKAADLYEKLLGKNPKSMYFYDNLLKAYLAENNFSDATKLVKKQNRKFENNPYYQVDIGYLLILQHAETKAESHFNELIQKLKPLDQAVFELAKAFEKRNEKKLAIETYLKGRKLLHSELAFSAELGGLYTDLGNTKEMIEEFLNVLVIEENILQEVQGYFQNSLKDNAEFDLLKLALVKRTKQYPERMVFQEMLIWLHVQKNEYELASLYARAIDKKYKEDGRRLIELGFLAMSNEKYDAAISIFKQVQTQGKDKPYFSLSKNSELEARSKKILQGNFTKEDLINLETEYINLLNEFGKNPMSASTMRNLANLEAFYLNNYEKAITQYEEIIQMPGVERNIQANCKLELADFYVMKGEVWDAMLLYGQVDKDFLQDPLGQEAKYRNARLSYYLGEFEWAKAQLDILKTATTQLISNNSIELSLLIQDNTIDSNLAPLQLFAKADLNYVQNNLSTSLSQLDSLQLLYPKHGLNDDILYKKAEIYLKSKDYFNAALYFNKVFTEYGSDILGDNALFQLAQLYQFKLNKTEDAKNMYAKFIDTYPGSFFLTECRKQFRILRGDQIN